MAKRCKHRKNVTLAGHDETGAEVLDCACGAVLWGPHRHVVQGDHGPPHAMRCDDCGKVLGARQLPEGRDPAEETGRICGACSDTRKMREAAGLPARKPGMPAWRRA